jgi:hypothetical protein
LKLIARHWRGICRDRLPNWSVIRPSEIKGQLPIVWYYDYDPIADDFIGRLAGIAITSVSSRPFKGTKLSELRPSDNFPRAVIRARRVLHEPALYKGYGIVYKAVESCGFGERIVMPLAAHNGNQAGIFGATEYRSLAEWERQKPESDVEVESWFP